MTDIIEIMARAICIDGGEDPDSIDGGLIMRDREGIRPNWEGYETAARACLTALSEAGYEVKKKEPVPAFLAPMVAAGRGETK